MTHYCAPCGRQRGAPRGKDTAPARRRRRAEPNRERCRHERVQRGREAAAAAAPRPAAPLAAGPGAERAGARPAAAAAGAGGRLLGALPAARGALAAPAVQGLQDQRLRPGAGRGSRLDHPLLPKVPRHENAARYCYVQSTDIPRGQNFRDGRNYSAPERRSR